MSSRFNEKPILNSPYFPPAWHHDLDDEGQPTDWQPLPGRRDSRLITPVPRAKKQNKKQASLALGDSLGLSTAEQEYSLRPIINQIRQHVDAWRALPNPSQWGVTPATRRLLQHWRNPEFVGTRPFFCQVEAVETAIWLAEVARGQKRYDLIRTHLANANEQSNPGLARVALKMATGSGKTTVMAMLIAWQAINAARSPGSRLYSRGFLIVAPGITIKDRLRVLQPNDPDNYYRTRNLVPADMLPELDRAKIVITNYHAFRRREVMEMSKPTRALIQGPTGEAPVTTETEGQMLNRAMNDLMGMAGRNGGIVVINDEAHHCYRSKSGDTEALSGDERKEAETNAKVARLWISGLEAASRAVGVTTVYDLSATPFFLRGSGYAEGTLFPWTVSDFSLMDAIESGIVKLPRIPVSDNLPNSETLTFRNLWDYVGSKMPKAGLRTGGKLDPAALPIKLLQALQMLYGHYEKVFDEWQREGIDVPPVFIVVCNNTTTSQLVYDWISGFERNGAGEERAYEPAHLGKFSNYDDHGRRLDRPNTLLIDSTQIDSGDAMDKAYRDANAAQIERFKQDRRTRMGHAEAEDISDEDLLREVMNTVGRPGRLGEAIRCVVSVSMLTEGWDTNTVTHILGVRAFGTQLLCEQVVGRGLRRRCYDLNDEGLFDAEYADIFGIPFDFAAQPAVAKPTPGKKQTRVHAVRERSALEIVFPRVDGYRTTLPNDRVDAHFTDDSRLVLTPELTGPCRNRNEGIVGEGVDMSMDDLKEIRASEISFRIAKHLIYGRFKEPGEPANTNLFGKVQSVARRWLNEYLVCQGGTSRSMVLYFSIMDRAAQLIFDACQRSAEGGGTWRAVLDPYTPSGSSGFVNFSTTRDVFFTNPDRSHVNAVVWDSTWEAEFARVAEGHPRVLAYVKNQGMQFEVPYVADVELHHYRPDFIVRLDVGAAEPLNLVVEIKGYPRGDAKLKSQVMRDKWVPGVNALGEFGRWAFAEFFEVYEIEREFDELIQRFVAEAIPAQAAA